MSEDDLSTGEYKSKSSNYSVNNFIKRCLFPPFMDSFMPLVSTLDDRFGSSTCFLLGTSAEHAVDIVKEQKVRILDPLTQTEKKHKILLHITHDYLFHLGKYDIPFSIMQYPEEMAEKNARYEAGGSALRHSFAKTEGLEMDIDLGILNMRGDGDLASILYGYKCPEYASAMGSIRQALKHVHGLSELDDRRTKPFDVDQFLIGAFERKGVIVGLGERVLEVHGEKLIKAPQNGDVLLPLPSRGLPIKSYVTGFKFLGEADLAFFNKEVGANYPHDFISFSPPN